MDYNDKKDGSKTKEDKLESTGVGEKYLIIEFNSI
jgi:hypothetical protein